MSKTLFCLGLGYSAQAAAHRLKSQGWSILGTARSAEKAAALERAGFGALVYDGSAPSPDVADALAKSSHLLMSAPPVEAGDPLLVHHGADIEASKSLTWIGYLSTIGVYGNHEGSWIDESASLNATHARGQRRIVAEREWLDLGARTGLPVQLFRLAGIYGPGRSSVEKVRSGQARRVIKPGQVFNRIHVDDIASVVIASIERPNSGAVYNVCDDDPVPPQDLITYAAELLNVEPPPAVPFDEADLTPMARSFYGENKRVSNDRIKSELGVELVYPSYRVGLKAIAEAG